MPNNDYILRSDVLQIECDLCIATHCKRDHQCVKAIRLNNLPAADVEPKQKWIPVTDVENLPKKSTPCLVSCNQWGGEIVRKAIFLASENCFTERGIDITEYVTHWMESPKPPEEVYNA